SGFLHHRPTFQQNVEQYLNYLIEDIGTPPSLEKANKIAQRLSLKIRYESPTLNWSTDSSLPPIHQLHFHQWGDSSTIYFGRYHRENMVVVKHKNGEFLFTISLALDHDSPRELWIVLLLIILTAILVGAYFLIRNVLRPVKWLSVGVQEVSNGNFNHQVPVRKPDELGQLTQAFNDMTSQIHNMLTSKEQLLLDVSHELRSPLTRIKVALESLPDNQAKQNIHEDILELEKMVAEILETARLDSDCGKLDYQNINIVPLLQELKSEFSKRCLDMRFAGMPAEVVLSIDIGRIRAVLQNIMSNAIKYSEPNSVIVCISLEQQEKYMVVQIQDQGNGISHEELPFIFEPFYRIDKSRSKKTGGYGLGLHLCKKIMEAHGGQIKVASILSEGTRISLFFPLPKAS
ncbi:MAG: HAMP domain-containing histidine kinase, partial [SAR324 cluster bacterium]|nr:HAMP domain-containing histidine kinase [SAR324 cluster bacterium]